MGVKCKRHKWKSIRSTSVRFSVRRTLQAKPITRRCGKRRFHPTPRIVRANRRFLFKWQQENATSGKKKMLILCHGHEHEKLLQSRYYTQYDMIFVDIREQCKPDVVLDIGLDLHMLFPCGPFDVIAFMHPPYTLFTNPRVITTVKQLLDIHGVLIFDDHKREDAKSIFQQCTLCHEICDNYFRIFHTLHHLYGECVVKKQLTANR